MTQPSSGSALGLSDRDLAAAFGVVQAVHDASDLNEFPLLLLRKLRTVVDYDLAGYNEIDPRSQRLILETWPPDHPRMQPWVGPRWAELMGEHPVANHYLATGDGSAHTISEFLTADQLHETTLYRDVYAWLRCEYQVSITLPAPHPLIVAIVLNRPDSDFGARDKAMLNLLRPHFVQAYRSVQLRSSFEALQRSAQQDGRGVLLLEAPDRVAEVSRDAADLIGDVVSGDRITDPGIVAWLTRAQAALQAHEGSAAGQLPQMESTYQVGTPHGTLLLRYVPHARGRLAAVICQRRGAYDASRLEALGLTPRQRDVMLELVRGSPIPAIADALGLSVATVRKHVENIYATLGVHERGAAVAQAIDAMLWA